MKCILEKQIICINYARELNQGKRKDRKQKTMDFPESKVEKIVQMFQILVILKYVYNMRPTMWLE